MFWVIVHRYILPQKRELQAARRNASQRSVGARREREREFADYKQFAEALAYLHEPYRPDQEWWLSAELIRKLLLTAVVPFAASTCEGRIMMALLVSVFFLVAHLWCRPYRKRFHNLLQAISHVFFLCCKAHRVRRYFSSLF